MQNIYIKLSAEMFQQNALFKQDWTTTHTTH